MIKQLIKDAENIDKAGIILAMELDRLDGQMQKGHSVTSKSYDAIEEALLILDKIELKVD